MFNLFCRWKFRDTDPQPKEFSNLDEIPLSRTARPRSRENLNNQGRQNVVVLICGVNGKMSEWFHLLVS